MSSTIQRGKRRAIAWTSGSLVFFFAAVAFAHDIWLTPDRFILERGDTLVVRQLTGTELEPERELPLYRRMTPRFELITPDGRVDLLSELPDERTRPEVKPVLERVVDFDGLALVTMEHAPIYTAWSREAFLEYLEHEDFELDRYEPHMGRGGKETERYSRSLKSLVMVGSVSKQDELYRTVLGQTLEIVLLDNPYFLDPGAELEARVLFEGRPLPNKQLMAFNTDERGDIAELRVRTDADGVARLRLDRRGLWLIRLVHLLPCGERAGLDCEESYWESFWASYSFQLQ